mmetsp:Transcript_79539/g.230892  ORF Transcript_79539/g.230892 Transcript_79539/m.230892 type:complete len:266 (-) Transcript_79539:580-1377(-)
MQVLVCGRCGRLRFVAGAEQLEMPESLVGERRCFGQEAPQRLLRAFVQLACEDVEWRFVCLHCDVPATAAGITHDVHAGAVVVGQGLAALGHVVQRGLEVDDQALLSHGAYAQESGACILIQGEPGPQRPAYVRTGHVDLCNALHDELWQSQVPPLISDELESAARHVSGHSPRDKQNLEVELASNGKKNHGDAKHGDAEHAVRLNLVRNTAETPTPPDTASTGIRSEYVGDTVRVLHNTPSNPDEQHHRCNRDADHYRGKKLPC